MEIINVTTTFKNESNNEYVVAIGNFDGIHLGHRKIISEAYEIAQAQNLKLAIMSFDITPRKVVNNINNYYLLKSTAQKEKILSELGVETIFLIQFDEAMRVLNPRDFIEKVIINNKIKYVVCGEDFRFGYQKQGDVNLLKEYQSFETISLPSFNENDAKISSTMIHELIMHGKIKKANQLLGQPYSLIGKVVKGRQKGREIGFPTANLLPLANYRIPANGVYACRVIIDDKEYLGMANIGHNPTFNFQDNTSIEINVFDFNEDIYDKIIEVIFVEMIRAEKLFDSIEELVEQISEDKQQILKIFE